MLMLFYQTSHIWKLKYLVEGDPNVDMVTVLRITNIITRITGLLSESRYA